MPHNLGQPRAVPRVVLNYLVAGVRDTTTRPGTITPRQPDRPVLFAQPATALAAHIDASDQAEPPPRSRPRCRRERVTTTPPTRRRSHTSDHGGHGNIHPPGYPSRTQAGGRTTTLTAEHDDPPTHGSSSRHVAAFPGRAATRRRKDGSGPPSRTPPSPPTRMTSAGIAPYESRMPVPVMLETTTRCHAVAIDTRLSPVTSDDDTSAEHERHLGASCAGDAGPMAPSPDRRPAWSGRARARRPSEAEAASIRIGMRSSTTSTSRSRITKPAASR